ncbi:CobW family GTP-binding protein [Paraburkholderia nodosa]|uniref:CobW family GTP-binding protein n=1 Tax=Paraburkholderia nodosa TaxID=392320 RepID=UPI000841EE51|nr:GTP-binding protein [Paraburkholderia nodosa]
MSIDPIPVTILTGFLGSGKTTLLNRLLRQSAMSRCAVVVNEIGEIGLDHLLIESTGDETIALLENGCLCCGVRGELAGTVDGLLARRQRGEIPPFERLWIETTGLARPGPVVSELLGDEALAGRIGLDGILATVDAARGTAQLARLSEARQQVAAADRLLITKPDLVDARAMDELQARLEELNPGVTCIHVRHGELDAQQLLDVLTPRTLFDWLRAAPTQLTHGWLTGPKAQDVGQFEPLANHAAQKHAHADIHTFSMTFDEPLPMQAMEMALTVLLAYYGEQILRVKGICSFAGETKPVVIHGVQQLLHEPVRLERWPDDDRRTRLVFITQAVDQAQIEATLAHFLRQGAPKAHIDAW